MLQYFIVVHRRNIEQQDGSTDQSKLWFFFIFLGNESGHNEHFNGFTCVFFVFCIFLVQLIWCSNRAVGCILQTLIN